MATKRSKNYCRSCADTWFPRGQALSDKCPTCKSTDVTFESIAHMPGPRASLQAGRPLAEATPQQIAAMEAAWRPPLQQQPFGPAPSPQAQQRPFRSSGGLKSLLIAFGLIFGLILLVVLALVLAVVMPSKKSHEPKPAPTHTPRR